MAAITHEEHLPALTHHARPEAGRDLQATLVELVDLSLIGKQLHRNIYGEPFKPLHEHLDERAGSRRNLADSDAALRELVPRVADVAERIRTRADRLGEIDLASQDVLIELVRELEKQLWMLRVSTGSD